ncbi:MAG: PocR ligand-binding domain-containing protein [bacterium]
MMETAIRLEEFCDMEKLYSLIDNWSKSTGMSAVIVDMEGNRTSESFGMTEFCQMIHDSAQGADICVSTWKDNKQGIYECPMGFFDFSIPILLPDGTQIGRVMAGQALLDEQNEAEIIKKIRCLDIDEAKYTDILSRIHKKTRKEMESAYALLDQILFAFVEKSYNYWQAKKELENSPATQDKILSQITKIL